MEADLDLWFDDYSESDDIQIDEYDITSTPNDFNVLTLYSFVEAGAVRIPGFQRNYVWDLARASKLIESLVLGLPVPQLFLYEKTRNLFLVIDGQQRLMSIYYFIKRRFPRKERRSELRMIFDREGNIPDAILHNDSYFEDFKLRLPERLPDHKNKFNNLNYVTLGDYKRQLDLRPIRNIIVRQNSPSGDDTSIYEVFNRLNTGGVNLTPQEIRVSMYHSDFYDMLYKINQDKRWRTLLPATEPDLHMKDIEILLRGFAMLIDGKSYSPSMVRFLNAFSKKCESHSNEQNLYLREMLESFLKSSEGLPGGVFINKGNNRFNLALYEAVFTATCEKAFEQRRLLDGTVSSEQILTLGSDPDFTRAASFATTRTSNVEKRLQRAKEIISSL